MQCACSLSHREINLVPRACDPIGQHQGSLLVPLDKGNEGSGDEISAKSDIPG